MSAFARIAVAWFVFGCLGYGQSDFGAPSRNESLRSGSRDRTENRAGGYSLSEMPMYGGVPKSASQLKADQAFIATATRDRGRTEAAAIYAQDGWTSFAKNDESTAMRRFNQAWLLDRNNYLALWGFAATSVARNNYTDAAKYFRLASERIESGPDRRKLLADYADALLQGALESPRTSDQKDALLEASRLFQQSSEVGKLSGHELSRWGEALFLLGRYDLAREKVEQAKRVDGHVHENLVNRLDEVQGRETAESSRPEAAAANQR